MTARSYIVSALAAAALFGATTPLAKPLLGPLTPWLLAGLFYLGSGIGLWLFRLIRDRGLRRPEVAAAEWPWLLAAIACGGVLGPVLLMMGLRTISGAAASLLLNLEAVLTALLAWIVFRENADRRVIAGMFLIVAGSIVLCGASAESTGGSLPGSLCIAAACLCWALDNNLTRKVSASDAVFIAGTKGLIAGSTNLGIALALGATRPSLPAAASAMAIGLAGYGVSLVLFVVALRGLGAARTGAYFSTAPFIGAGAAVLLLHEPLSPAFWIAATLMAVGVWLHLTEHHEHEHTHEELTHGHVHVHDEHHQHTHELGWDGGEPHTHVHHHAVLTHRHPHYPNVHHRHAH